MDTVVFDIETKNTIAEVGGKENLHKLETSLACFYSYNKDAYFCFQDTQFSEMKAFLSQPRLLVGFSSNKFDIPILARELELPLFEYPRIDISDEIELRTGRLIGLSELGRVNFGLEKTGSGLEAPKLYREGKIQELAEYCQNDVELTKKLFDKIKKEKKLLIPERESDSVLSVEIDLSQALMLLL